ncbi:hypothetical protein GCM10010446_27530 [Streptomyces enissocaesilis]|uniref:Uncharacterized protein n=1 Tax=Streptomyces enissocaesilis TaxID=332589 RepID=A0ABN3X990_9ACTN
MDRAEPGAHAGVPVAGPTTAWRAAAGSGRGPGIRRSTSHRERVSGARGETFGAAGGVSVRVAAARDPEGGGQERTAGRSRTAVASRSARLRWADERPGGRVGCGVAGIPNPE